MDWPPPGFGAIDAVATLNGTVYAWWNGFLAWSDPSRPNDGWEQLDRKVSKIDAATEFGDQREVLLFVGTEFWRFDLVDKLVVNFGYAPYSLSSGNCDLVSAFNPVQATGGEPVNATSTYSSASTTRPATTTFTSTETEAATTATPSTTTQAPSSTTPPAFSVDAVSYNSTENLFYFFKGLLYTTCLLDKSTWTFSNGSTSGPARIADHFGQDFPALRSQVSAAGVLNSTSYLFVHDLLAVVSQARQILSPGAVSSFRTSTCQLCRCSDTSSNAQRCSPDHGAQVGVPECVVPPELASLCVASNGLRPYLHAGQHFAQCLQCECASPCAADGTCMPREPFCYDFNNNYVAQNQSAACFECEQLCAFGSCSRMRINPFDGVVVRICNSLSVLSSFVFRVRPAALGPHQCCVFSRRI
jgi:hypothetical protein